MAVQVLCPNCGKPARVSDEHFGRMVRCPACQTKFRLSETMVAARSLATSGEAAAAKATLDTSRAAAPITSSDGLPAQIGRYQVRALLGAGAFGTVYRALDPQLEREVALKVPQAAALDSPRAVERFLREAKAAAGLRHPHIVPVYDAGSEGDLYYIASAFIEGRTLAQAITDDDLDLRQAAQIVRALAEALTYAHGQRIVHRDVKPANVMLDTKGAPHLMDFGLAHQQDATQKLTQDGALLGTPAYMAPEMAQGQSEKPQPASDQYSLGVVLYELLTGQTPFSGPPQIVLFNAINREPPAPRSLKPDVPLDLETICLKALAKRPENRYQSCQEMADDLQRWLAGEPIRARRLGLAERVVRWYRRERKLAWTATAAAGGLLLLAVVAAGSVPLLATLARHETEARNASEQVQQAELEAKKLADAARQEAENDRKQIEKLRGETEASLADVKRQRQAVVKSRTRVELERKQEGQLLAQAVKADLERQKSLQETTQTEQAIKIVEKKTQIAKQEQARAEALVRAKQGLPMFTLPHEKSIFRITFSRDNRRLAVASDNTATVWDPSTGEKHFTCSHESQYGQKTVTVHP